MAPIRIGDSDAKQPLAALCLPAKQRTPTTEPNLISALFFFVYTFTLCDPAVFSSNDSLVFLFTIILLIFSPDNSVETQPVETMTTISETSHDGANTNDMFRGADLEKPVQFDRAAPAASTSAAGAGAGAAGPPPPPDGGLVAWLQVAAGFLLFFNTWGMINTFAVFQTYYESGVLFQASSSDISWIGSIQCFLLQLTGLVAGPVYDRGHLRALLVSGSFLVVFGFMILSLCTQFWQALLAQAFCVGIGAGLLFTPTVSLIPTWFSSHMSLAIGIASAGSSLGGVIYPIVLYQLIDKVGFPWAVRSLGFIALATFILPVAVMKMRIRAPKPRAMVDWSAFVDVPFMVFTLGMLIVFIGNAVLIFYISFYPQNRGFTDTSLSFYMAAIFNAASIFGRIVPNAISDCIGVFNTIAPVTLVLGITVLCMLAVQNETGIIVEAIVTGFFSGVVVALPPVCFRMLTDNKAMIGTRIGQGFAIAGLGLLIGGPSSGAILGSAEPLNWNGLWAYGGVAGCIGGLILVAVRVIKAGVSMSVKV
ncbi:Putative Monocarboxylate permease homologue, mch4 [[Torrubiella] hemipterigena]|uniref:Putative Monocarboxylate permease homologue, mch4 n=1 Tax=[Torrubiella] hemipterigena TaxID=1531966 RepID=A0A0A1TR88_9HYPO|nr:Putative Monocarboxylate permease homologue, mch4 [[Torrubiella] hemipterigena]